MSQTHAQPTLETLVSLAKRRGFVYPRSNIVNNLGFSNFETPRLDSATQVSAQVKILKAIRNS
ncbi:MAG: hypothetical protein AAF629_35315 [Chloroflexota bacterium]